ncbi:hypothetical protein PV08_03889 [Exophiala spinifera]|uniref:Methyltransferase domain-containing protein n=1 Tax=Exophiala spinifera TaxID=91928 RepID=A0A0D1YNM2_9EURO|nr:uncharacterized protein PV08_03889 [Exophiala spinifera]KIW16701.1 hypothetical protein PV08_03889 [Exophiala spinifera]
MPSSEAVVSEAINHYTSRAGTYDAATGGWHAVLGCDYVDFLPPPRGGAVLDLACGTGLVSLPYAQAVGPDGVVVGVDITDAMLDEARQKPVPAGSGAVHWVKADVADLSSIDAVQEVRRERGGFDVISCCSALVLLHDPAACVRHWATYLVPGTGRIIIDVPTEDRTLQKLFTVSLRKSLGLPNLFDREWIRDIHSLEHMYEGAGLEVEESFRTKSYIPERVFGLDEGMTVFEEASTSTYQWVRNSTDLLARARDVWPVIWKESLNDNEKHRDGHWLYVTIGARTE